MKPHRGTGVIRPAPAESAKAVQRALDILLEFLNHGGEVGVTDLSRRLQLPKATVHRLVATLGSRAFLARNAETAKYRLGLSVFRLGSQFLDQLDVRKAALSVMKDLAEQTAETINLNIVRDRRRVCIEKIESRHDIRHFVELGRPVPLYAGASGKVLLAHLDRVEIAAIIAEGLLPLTPRTVVSAVKLQQELAAIRRLGYATSADERVVGAASVSAPICDAAAGVVAGLTISGPSYRFTHETVGRCIDLVVQGAADISTALGAPKEAKVRG